MDAGRIKQRFTYLRSKKKMQCVINMRVQRVMWNICAWLMLMNFVSFVGSIFLAQRIQLCKRWWQMNIFLPLSILNFCSYYKICGSLLLWAHNFEYINRNRECWEYPNNFSLSVFFSLALRAAACLLQQNSIRTHTKPTRMVPVRTYVIAQNKCQFNAGIKILVETKC